MADLLPGPTVGELLGQPLIRHRPPVKPVAERLAHYLRPGTLTLAALPPLSLYVHLPWCLKKCPYCDFNSHAPQAASSGAAAADLPMDRYLDALMADLEASLPFIWGRRVHTVFIGGGTPSLFNPDQIATLIQDIRARLPLDAGCEITLEANPATFEAQRFRGYRDAGVTRLSLGVQSFDDQKLAALGRLHDAAQARAAIEEARTVFDTFNIDLMYALPGQTLAEFESDLASALSFEPPHLSLYHLTLEPNTVFAKYPPALPDDDAAADMLDMVIAQTEARGLARYEVSAFARSGHRCEHNWNYWQFGDYLGIGAGAHGKLSFPSRVIRQTRVREPTLYMTRALAADAIATEDEVPRSQLPFEFMLNATRLKSGFELARFQERTGLSLAALTPGLDAAEQKGLMARDLTRAWPTAHGFDFLNDLQLLFLP